MLVPRPPWLYASSVKNIKTKKIYLGVIWIYWHGCSKLYDSDDHKYGTAAHGLKTSFCLIGISRPLEPTEARTSFLHGLYTRNFLKGSKVTNTYSVASLRFPAPSFRLAVFLWIEKAAGTKITHRQSHCHLTSFFLFMNPVMNVSNYIVHTLLTHFT